MAPKVAKPRDGKQPIADNKPVLYWNNAGRRARGHPVRRVVCTVHALGRYSSTREAPSLLERCLALRDREPVAFPARPTGRRLVGRIDDADRKTIVTAYVAGSTSLAQLAERYGVSDYSIRMILRKAGVPPQRRKVTAEQTAQVHELWAEGLKPEAIAAEVGMGHANVRLIVAELK